MASLASEVRKQVQPLILKAGFSGDYPEYTRSVGQITQIINLQVSKYGGGYFINVYAFTEEQLKAMKWRDFSGDERVIPAEIYWRQTGRVKYGILGGEEIRYGTNYAGGAQRLQSLLPRIYRKLDRLTDKISGPNKAQ